MIERLGVHLPAKLLVLGGLTLGICIPYFGLQHLIGAPEWTPSATPLDDAIAFDARWVWVYHSLVLLVPIVPLMATRREELVRYANGLVLLCLPCFAIFALFPVAGPRPEAAALIARDNALYQLILGLDGTGNSLPSLHVGLTLYNLCFGYHLAKRALTPERLRVYVIAATVWGTAIVFSTLAIKQHWLIDLPPGALLGWLACRFSWRDAA